MWFDAPRRESLSVAFRAAKVAQHQLIARYFRGAQGDTNQAVRQPWPKDLARPATGEAQQTPQIHLIR